MGVDGVGGGEGRVNGVVVVIVVGGGEEGTADRNPFNDVRRTDTISFLGGFTEETRDRNDALHGIA